MLVIVVVIFVVCWTPRILWEFIFAEDGKDGVRKDFGFGLLGMHVELITHLLVMWSYLNSVANAVVYYFTSR